MQQNAHQPSGKALLARGAVALAISAIVASPANAQSRHLDPARIDRAITDFTGKEMGQIGGARYLADKRLKLADCARPLSVSWHGNGRANVRVACTDPSPWEVFVAIVPAPKPAANALAAPAVKRGDAVTIVVEGQGFTIRRTAIAQQNGAPGDWITVKHDRRGKSVSAQIVRPGLVRLRL